MSPAVRVEHLKKRYGAIEAVKDISFSVQPGEIFGLFSPMEQAKPRPFVVSAPWLNPTVEP